MRDKKTQRTFCILWLTWWTTYHVKKTTKKTTSFWGSDTPLSWCAALSLERVSAIGLRAETENMLRTYRRKSCFLSTKADELSWPRGKHLTQNCVEWYGFHLYVLAWPGPQNLMSPVFETNEAVSHGRSDFRCPIDFRTMSDAWESFCGVIHAPKVKAREGHYDFGLPADAPRNSSTMRPESECRGTTPTRKKALRRLQAFFHASPKHEII